MKAKENIIRFLVLFAIAFVANVLVSLIWSYFVKKTGWSVDWPASFRISIMLAVILLLLQRKRKG